MPSADISENVTNYSHRLVVKKISSKNTCFKKQYEKVESSNTCRNIFFFDFKPNYITILYRL